MADIAVIVKNNVQVIGNLSAPKSLIFIHGFGTDQSSWSQITPPFLADHKIVLFDNVGAGQSASAAFVQHRYLGLDRYAQDLLDICHALQLNQAVLIGHSVGGMIGALAATQEPDFFSKLVLMSSSPRYLNDEGYHGGFTQADLQQTYSAVIGNFTKWVDAFAPMAVNNPQDPQMARHFAAALRKIPPEHALTVLCSILQSDHRADLARIRIPTLIMQSRGDFFVPPEVAHYLHRHITGSELAWIDAQGHFPQLSAPQVVIEALHRFV